MAFLKALPYLLDFTSYCYWCFKVCLTQLAVSKMYLQHSEIEKKDKMNAILF